MNKDNNDLKLSNKAPSYDSVEFEWYCKKWKECQTNLLVALENCFNISTEETFDSDWLNPDVTDDELKVKFLELTNKIDSLNSQYKVYSADELSKIEKEAKEKGYMIGE